MAKLIIKLTKQPQDPWILLSDTSQFTQEEIDTIITPYYDYVKTLPGIQVQTPFPEPVITDNTSVSTLLFDTNKDIIVARDKLFLEPKDAAVINKNALIRQKLMAAGVKYTVETELEPNDAPPAL